MNNNVEILSSDSVPFFFYYLMSMLKGGEGGFFSADVYLRTRPELRKFNAVVVDVDLNNNLATVWDAYAGDYREVNLDGVKAVKTNHTTYYFTK